jgi:hypothetical protein
MLPSESAIDVSYIIYGDVDISEFTIYPCKDLSGHGLTATASVKVEEFNFNVLLDPLRTLRYNP